MIAGLVYPIKEPSDIANPDDLQAATKLHTTLVSKSLITTPPSSMAKWADQFRILRNTTPMDIICEVLDWYISHVDHPWVPTALSAKSFRIKFHNIQKAMERHREQHPVQKKDPAAARLVARLHQNLSWPAHSQPLETVVADGLDLVRELRTANTLVRDGADSIRTACCNLLDYVYPETAVYEHYAKWCRSVQTWSDWSGHHKKMTIDDVAAARPDTAFQAHVKYLGRMIQG